MTIKVMAPGSCGELVQGTIDGKNFLITCPINRYSEIEIIPDRQDNLNAGTKTLEAINKTLAYLNIPSAGFGIKVNSDLPKGKGMASSSADISAACQAVALKMKKTLTPDEIADIALAIEPTDAVFYPGIVMFDHLHGKVRHSLGVPPAMRIAVFDVGGKIDTVHFNKNSDLPRLNSAKEKHVRQAVDLILKGLKTGDASLVGRGATLSALANQSILYKPCLETIINIGERFGAVGVNTAHSGTVTGILFAEDRLYGLQECINEVQKACPELEYLYTVELISGGLLVCEGEDNE